MSNASKTVKIKISSVGAGCLNKTNGKQRAHVIYGRRKKSLEKRLRKDWTKQRKDSRAAATAALVFSI